MTKHNLNIKIKNEIKENSDLFCSIRRSEIAHHFKSFMIKKGLKIADVAERLDVSAANISRMLNGKQNLTLDNIHALADALQERIIVAFESEWRRDDEIELESYLSPSEDKWCVSDRFQDINLRSYKGINLEAANEDFLQVYEWAGNCETSFLEQRA